MAEGKTRSWIDLPLIMALALVIAWGHSVPVPATVHGSTGTADFDCGSVADIPQVECRVLIALYNSTNGSGWYDKAGWLVTNMPCNWYGLTCTGGHVSNIDLDNNHVGGSIPPELGDLARLRELTLSNNCASGSIPPELGNLTELEVLDLFDSCASGPIPPELGNLANLKHLDLGGNDRITGTIPWELANLAKLQVLSLDFNQLSGNIPPELGSLADLQRLTMLSNHLSGGIPPTLGNLSNLQWLLLGVNQLSGTVPPDLGNLSHLQGLVLSANPLIGPLPSNLTSLTELTMFWFDDTGLCEPGNSAFQTWLAGIQELKRTGVLCQTTYLPMMVQ